MTDLEDRLPDALNRLADRAGHAETWPIRSGAPPAGTD